MWLILWDEGGELEPLCVCSLLIVAREWIGQREGGDWRKMEWEKHDNGNKYFCILGDAQYIVQKIEVGG